MNSWSSRPYCWENDAIGPIIIFGSISEPRVKGKEVFPQLLGETYPYYFPDLTVLEPIRASMTIWVETPWMLRRVLRNEELD